MVCFGEFGRSEFEQIRMLCFPTLFQPRPLVEEEPEQTEQLWAPFFWSFTRKLFETLNSPTTSLGASTWLLFFQMTLLVATLLVATEKHQREDDEQMVKTFKVFAIHKLPDFLRRFSLSQISFEVCARI